MVETLIDKAYDKYFTPDINNSQVKTYTDVQLARLLYDAYSKGVTDKQNEDDELNESGEGTDGYHSFNELYYYRMLYNALFVNCMRESMQEMYNVYKTKRHDNGELCFGGGWFLVSVELPTGQITNHYEMKYWDLFHCKELPCAEGWDGHTPEVAAERMFKFLNKYK